MPRINNSVNGFHSARQSSVTNKYPRNWKLISQLVKNPPAMQETPVQLLGREYKLERDRLPTPVFLGFPCGSADKESTCNTGDLGSIPGLGRSSGEGKGYPLQYSGLENSMDCIVHGVTKTWTGLSEAVSVKSDFKENLNKLRAKHRLGGKNPLNITLNAVLRSLQL